MQVRKDNQAPYWDANGTSALADLNPPSGKALPKHL